MVARSWSQVKSFPDIATSASARRADVMARACSTVGIVFVVFDPASGKPGATDAEALCRRLHARDQPVRIHDGGATLERGARSSRRGCAPTTWRARSDGTFYLSYGDEPGPNTMNDGAVWKYAPASGEVGGHHAGAAIHRHRAATVSAGAR